MDKPSGLMQKLQSRASRQLLSNRPLYSLHGHTPARAPVVAERAHAQPHLAQVVEVLQAGALAQVDAVRDVLAQHEGGHLRVARGGGGAGGLLGSG